MVDYIDFEGKKLPIKISFVALNTFARGKADKILEEEVSKISSSGFNTSQTEFPIGRSSCTSLRFANRNLSISHSKDIPTTTKIVPHIMELKSLFASIVDVLW